ncbi:YheT family hydrolase [Cesiribacter andamanensis]|uniref:Putative hydrolase n=1 Tax=Cesiribacter andamanensis AMV16 TaxID=1279009 RepID=M7N5H0_9BACT|nr:alpha/beta fold hydrolase [Cesiribacter andamanensis]EMR02476.1 putative hydrolase [Cesiribacter andamanensis AMV16]
MHPYKAPWYLPNGHFQTIVPSLFRRVPHLPYQRERIATPDGDFLDLDWIRPQAASDTLLIISHGLEGDSRRAYVKGMARAFVQRGLHALAWNYRGCSGEINKLPHFYHSGATQDLEQVVQHVLQQGVYNRIILSGFSLGGNLTLKYLGERGEQVPNEIWKAVVFSVPLDLASSSSQLGRRQNRVYEKRFLRNLRRKLEGKARLQPGSLDLAHLPQIRTLWEFDDRYTAPLHGFKDAADYYAQCSAIKFVEQIRIPTLIVNAQNDPFLSPECYPQEMLKDHPYVRFEAPAQGGHVGFSQGGGRYYSEARALQFVLEE